MENNLEENLETSNLEPKLMEPEESPYNKFKELAKYFGLLAVIIVVTTSLSLIKHSKSSVTPLSNTETTAINFEDKLNNLAVKTESAMEETGIKFRSDIINLQFIIPEEWDETDGSKVTLPEGNSEQAIVLSKSNSSCVISVTKNDAKVLQQKRYLGTSDDVFGHGWQFIGGWYEGLPSNSEDSILPGKYRRTVDKEGNLYMLFNSEGSLVSDDCNSGFNLLLRSVKPYYDTIQLTSESFGSIRVNKVWDYVTPNNISSDYEQLVFTDEITKETKKVMQIPNNSSQGPIFIHDNKFVLAPNPYVLKNEVESSIYILDPYTGTTSQVPGSNMGDSKISSIYVYADTIFYLVGPNVFKDCYGVDTSCLYKLYSIPITGGKPTLVSRTQVDGSIFAYRESDNTIYFSQEKVETGFIYVKILKMVNGELDKEPYINSVYRIEANETEKAQYKKEVSKMLNLQEELGKEVSSEVRIDGTVMSLQKNDSSDYAVFYSIK